MTLKQKKYRNSETVTMVSFKHSSALQMTPFIHEAYNKWMSRVVLLAPSGFFKGKTVLVKGLKINLVKNISTNG